MAKVIRREELANLQPVKLAAFDRPASPGPKPASAQTPAPLSQARQKELLAARDAARQEGLRQGFEEGRKQGYETGLSEAQQQMAALQGLIDLLDTTRLRQDQEIAQEILELALTVAQQVVRGAVEVNREILLQAIREAMLALPSLEPRYRIIAHPADAEAVRVWIDQEHSHLGWEVMDDAQIERGGFRIESAHSELDGTLSTRWQQVVESLGAELSWLDSNG